MPVVYTLIFLCEGCGKTETYTSETVLNDEVSVTPPSKSNWDYHNENLYCQTCMKKVADPEKKIPPEHRALAEYLKQRVLEVRQQKITEKTILKWCNDVRLMVSQDGRTTDDIYSIIKECHDMEPRGASGFTWRNNILSMGKLRQRWNEGKIFIGMTGGSTRWSGGYGRQEVSNEELKRQMQHDAQEL